MQHQRRTYILFTYRSKIIKALPTTYYNSDAGWGCMLRVAQMLIANLLLLREKATLKNIVPMFYDNQPMPFSIQKFTQAASQIYPHKKEYDWFDPCHAGNLIKHLLQSFDDDYHVCIGNQNSLFLNELYSAKGKVLVMIMCRIGLNEPQQPYLECVGRLTKIPYFMSIMGGTPKRAHLFLEYSNNKFGYLDPHKTLKTPPTIEQLMEKLHEYHGQLQWISEEDIDCSMAISFAFQTSQIDTFWNHLENIKKQYADKFFIYIDQQKPQLNQNDILQAIDQI